MALGKTTPEANAALAKALQAYVHRAKPDDFSALLNFTKRNPQSPWRASVLATLGSVFLERGSYSTASELLQSAWKLTGGEAPTLDHKLLASAVAADLATVLAKTGRKADLQGLLATLSKKELFGSSRTQVLAASVSANATPVSRAPAGACFGARSFILCK